MGLGNFKQKIYLNIKDGKVRKTDPETKEITYYEYIEGYLTNIATPERDYGKIWEFDFIDPVSNESYSLTMSYNSGVARSILNSLASVDGSLGLIKIKPYFVNDFNKVVCYSDGTKLNWKYTQLPEIKEITVDGKTFKDDTQRVKLFEDIATELRDKINNKETVLSNSAQSWEVIFKD